MIDNVLQCCYTNASQEANGKLSSGWQAVAVSEAIPSDAYHTCVRLQNANSSIQGAMVDEAGQVLNLLEFCGDGAYLYVMRTQYGLLDRLGRANMFSHAYIFPWKDEAVLTDPNTFLTLCNENFKDNEADAMQAQASLVRTPPFALVRAMQAAGLSAKLYPTLIQCVYTQMSERRITEPLSIQYDGTEQQMRALLYCIYYGLPYYLRRTLCAASAATNNTAGKNLIFSRFANRQIYYIIPQTGENNVLSSRIERKIARYGFIDHIAKNIGSLSAPEYLDRLEKMAVSLGDPAASNELILKIAHQILDSPRVESYSSEDLDGRLSDALRAKTYGSQLMENYIASMLKMVCERKLHLTEESEANLADWLSAPCSPGLTAAGEQYNLYRFSVLSPDDAARRLSQMSGEALEKHIHALEATPEGLAILDVYYAEFLLPEQPLDWEKLDDASRSLNSRKHYPKTVDRLDALAWTLYSQSLAEEIQQPLPVYNRYMDIMERLLPEKDIVGCEEAARNEYWERMTFDGINLDALANYRAMRTGQERCRMLSGFYDLLQKLEEENFLDVVQSFFSQFRGTMRDGEAAKAMELLEQAVETQYHGGDQWFQSWVRLAATAESCDLHAKIYAVRKSLYRRKFDKMVDQYGKFVEAVPDTDSARELTRRLNEVILAVCRTYDTSETPVPLDVWLSVGGQQYENAFQLLDEIKPCVLKDGSTEAAKSRLLKKPRYASDAEKYIQEHGESFKIVRKWLNEARQEDDPGGSILGKGRSLISKFTQDSSDSESDADASSDKKNKFKKGIFGRK